jgi:hypothetical protein
MFGATVWLLYVKGQLKAVDTTLSLLLYAGIVDSYVCWSQGEIGKAWFRGLLNSFFGVWGLMGWTTG